MTVTLPTDLETELSERATRLKIPVDRIVTQALNWYMSIDPELLEEIADWEATGVEDMLKFEESLQ